LDEGKAVMHQKTFGRRIFVYLTNGQISANDMALESKDQARIDIEEPLTLYAEQNSELILIDVPSCKGWGYSADTLKGQDK
jgi:redox-sensitive bicupin YhaK (pirin superfamily)